MTAPSLAFVAECRAERLVSRINQIASDPADPSQGSLPQYREAARLAFEAAAANAEQPAWRP